MQLEGSVLVLNLALKTLRRDRIRVVHVARVTIKRRDVPTDNFFPVWGCRATREGVPVTSFLKVIPYCLYCLVLVLLLLSMLVLSLVIIVFGILLILVMLVMKIMVFVRSL